MLTIVYLGTGAALPAPGRDNTSLAIDDGVEVTLIDTSGSPFKRLIDADLSVDRLARVIITHEHPDHTFGLPSLLQNLWLAGRTEPLPIYALEETWVVLHRLIGAYWPDGWTRGFALDERIIDATNTAQSPSEKGMDLSAPSPSERGRWGVSAPSPSGRGRGVRASAPFVETDDLTLWAARGQHSVPSVGVRVESSSGAVAVYSADTSPSDNIIALGRDANLLIHESTFVAGEEETASSLGHSTASQAAEVAVRARAARLALIHFTPTPRASLELLHAGAATIFSGPIDTPGETTESRCRPILER